MNEEKEITFESLMDGKLHEVYMVDGTKCQKYMAKIHKGKKPPKKHNSYWDRNNPVDNNTYILVDLYDKNGKNRIQSYDYYAYTSGAKTVVIDMDKLPCCSAVWVDGYNKRILYLTKDSAYRCIMNSLNKKKLEINKKIIAVQENFDLIEKKKRFTIKLK